MCCSFPADAIMCALTGLKPVSRCHLPHLLFTHASGWQHDDMPWLYARNPTSAAAAFAVASAQAVGVLQAGLRHVDLRLQMPGMTRRKANTSKYDHKRRRLSWCMSWHFPAANVDIFDREVDEHAKASDLLKVILIICV